MFKFHILINKIYNFVAFESHTLIFGFTLQYVASASGEIYNLLTGKSQLTFAAIIKLIDEDILPRDNVEWSKNALEKAKQFLAVITKKTLDIYT